MARRRRLEELGVRHTLDFWLALLERYRAKASGECVGDPAGVLRAGRGLPFELAVEEALADRADGPGGRA